MALMSRIMKAYLILRYLINSNGSGGHNLLFFNGECSTSESVFRLINTDCHLTKQSGFRNTKS